MIDMVKVSNILKNNKDEWEIVEKSDKVDVRYGCDAIFVITEKDIEALRQGKILYHGGCEYSHLMVMEE